LQALRAINTKGEYVKMDKLKNILVVLLIAVVVSFGQMGCKQESEHPSGDHPTSEHPASEHPTEEAPTEEAPTEETPTEETPSEEHPTGEHPTGDHPTGEHPTLLTESCSLEMKGLL